MDEHPHPADGATPLPFAQVAAAVGLPAAPPDPEAALAAHRWGHPVQDLRALCDGLEWQLSRRVWIRQGARPFVEGGVPNQVNNSGTLSAAAAALLLEALREHPVDGPIRVLEIGAGLGLFARLLLDELAQRCAEQGRDEYARLEFWVTDLSPSGVRHWQQVDLFGPHADRVVLRACAAEEAATLQAGPWHVVFANYVLDVLPARVLRQGEAGWEELHARCWIRADAATLARYTPLSPAELRAHAQAGDEAALDALLPLVPLLESELEFAPATEVPAGLDDAPRDRPFTVNTGALRCLDTLLPRLAAGGLCLVSDFAGAVGSDTQTPTSQRFGPVTAIGLDLPALEAHVRAAGLQIAAGDGDGEHPLQHRLITRGAAPRTRACFEQAFSVTARQWRDEPLDAARHHAASGRWGRALQAYREALARAPGDWALLTEVAAFAGTELADAALAETLAHAALGRNPWSNPRGWCVLGDALAAQQRPDQALPAYDQALRIHSHDPAAWLGLARVHRALARPNDALLAVARGLACDAESMFRHLLLAEQAQALEALAVNWGVERAAAARRSG